MSHGLNRIIHRIRTAGGPGVSFEKPFYRAIEHHDPREAGPARCAQHRSDDREL